MRRDKLTMVPNKRKLRNVYNCTHTSQPFIQLQKEGIINGGKFLKAEE